MLGDVCKKISANAHACASRVGPPCQKQDRGPPGQKWCGMQVLCTQISLSDIDRGRPFISELGYELRDLYHESVSCLSIPEQMDGSDMDIGVVY